MIVDTVITHAKVVGPGKTLEDAWVAIDGEKVVAVAERIDPPEARQTIDAQGRYLIPGIIDTHTHPGVHRSFADDVATETRSAAAGGVTTFMGTIKCTRMTRAFKVFAEPEDVCSYTKVFPEAVDIVKNDSWIDMVFTFAVFADIHAAEVPIYAKDLGVTSFKFYHGYKDATPFARRIGLPTAWDDGTLYYGLEQIGKIGGLALFHAENNQVNRILTDRLMAMGRTDLAAWEERSPDWSEAIDIIKFATLAKFTKTRIFVVHTSSKLGLAETVRQRSEGVEVVSETCPQYMILNKYDDPHPGGLAKVNTPIRGVEDNEALWHGVQKGLITCMGSDNVSSRKETVYVPGNIWECIAGFPGIETLLPLMLSEGVQKKRITMERLVEVMSTNNAKEFGLYPQKGIIAPGSDADLVLCDMQKRDVVRADRLHSWSDFSVYEGRELTGWPVMTMLRGAIIYRDGQFVGTPRGRYVPRTH